jgi:acylphosphatase
MARIRTRVLVSGRVQGVWFRGSTRDRARELGLSGWARNLIDGRVEAVFEGEQEAVRAAVDYVREGPPHARVSAVEVLEETPIGESGEFRILYD